MYALPPLIIRRCSAPPQPLAPGDRRPQHLFPRPRWTLAGARHARIVDGLLGQLGRGFKSTSAKPGGRYRIAGTARKCMPMFRVSKVRDHWRARHETSPQTIPASGGGGCGATGALGSAAAEAYPARPVRLIIMFPAGQRARHHRPACRSMAVGAARPAIHCREQAGRRRQHRHRICRARPSPTATPS